MLVTCVVLCNLSVVLSKVPGLTLAVLQRPQQDGRRIQNYDEALRHIANAFLLMRKGDTPNH